MPLTLREATHVHVVCDSCRSASAELCGKRDLAVTARAQAVPRFKAAGWHHDPGTQARTRTAEQVERDGAGRWYCPACCRQKHL